MFEVLEFPKTEVERKPQRNVQADFIKRTLKRKAGSTEEREGLWTGSGAAQGAAFTSWDGAASCGLVRKGGLGRVPRGGI